MCTSSCSANVAMQQANPTLTTDQWKVPHLQNTLVLISLWPLLTIGMLLTMSLSMCWLRC